MFSYQPTDVRCVMQYRQYPNLCKCKMKIYTFKKLTLLPNVLLCARLSIIGQHIFDCRKQSLNWLLLSSIHPILQDKTFLQFFFVDLLFLTRSSFNFFGLCQFCSKLYHFLSQFPQPLFFILTFSTFWNKQIMIFLYEIDPPLNFKFIANGNLNKKIWPFLTYLLKI